jgi:hypothetical protein
MISLVVENQGTSECTSVKLCKIRDLWISREGEIMEFWPLNNIERKPLLAGLESTVISGSERLKF